jgi:hypothetical protein
MKHITNWYPKAKSAITLTEEYYKLIQAELNLTPENILVATSICSDDINMIEYPDIARKTLGPFVMGGLNGFPFAGLTGLGAFAGHVPINGAVSILYGPHIGVSQTGELGKVLRVGHTETSNCCGACALAVKNATNDLDYQQNTLEQLLLKSESRIKNATSHLKEATEVIFEAIDERIRLLVSKTKFSSRYVILYGVIIINSEAEYGAYCEVRNIDILDTETGVLRKIVV